MAIRYRVQPDDHLGVRTARKADHSNVFLSDIDLSAWIERDFETNSVRVRNIVLAARRIFPFVGELEMYRTGEWEELIRLRKTTAAIYDFLRDLRKIVWMEIGYAQSSTEYGRYKALRSIRLCLERLTGSKVPIDSIRSAGNVGAARTAVMKLIERNFQDELSRIPSIETSRESAQSFCTYLGFKLETLELPPKHALILFGICPLVNCATRTLEEAVQSARKEPRIHATWSALAKMEWIYFQASNRTYADERDWTPAWNAALENELTKTAVPLNAVPPSKGIARQNAS